MVFNKIFKKKDPSSSKKDEGLMQKDKEILNALISEGKDHLKELQEIDQEILTIQKSTKTTFSFFAPVHNYCRTKYQWYYNWSIKPYATKVHVGVLTMVLLASLSIGSLSLLSHPKPSIAAPNTVATSTSATATANPFQRKTWYDGTRYWSAFYTGSEIDFYYSTNGSSWTKNTSATLSISSSDFSIDADSTYAYIVYSDGMNIYAAQAKSTTSYPGTSFSWGAATQVASATVVAGFPVVARDSSGKLWVSFKGGSSVSSFLAGTKVSMAAGSTKNIEDIQAGDKIAGFDDSDKPAVNNVLKSWSHRADSYLTIKTASSEIKVTPSHLLYIGGGQFTLAGDIKIGDQLYVSGGAGKSHKEPVLNIETVTGNVTVYDISTDNYNDFIANNLWVHNGGGTYVYARQSSNANDVTSWSTLSTISASKTNLIPSVVSIGSNNVYEVYLESATIKGKKFTSGTGWDSSWTTITNANSTGSDTNIATVADTNGNIHLVYIDGSGYVQYQEYTSGTWQSAIQLDGNAGNTDATISTNSSDNSIYAYWLRGGTVYEEKAVSPYASSNWDPSATSVSTGTNASLSASYLTTTSKAFALWTNGAGSPYNVNFDNSVSSGVACTYASARSGNWSSASTWVGGCIPGTGNNTTITAGQTVTVDSTQNIGTGTLTVNGILNQSAALTAGDTTIASGGTLSTGNNALTVGTLSNAGTLTAGTANVVIANSNWSNTGTWTANTSSVQVHGTTLTAKSGDTFYDLTTAYVAAGTTTLSGASIVVSHKFTVAGGTISTSWLGITMSGTGTVLDMQGSAAVAGNTYFVFTGAGSTVNIPASNNYCYMQFLSSGTGTYQLQGDIGAKLINVNSSWSGTGYLSTLDLNGHTINQGASGIGNNWMTIGSSSAQRYGTITNSSVTSAQMNITSDLDIYNYAGAHNTLNASNINISIKGNWYNYDTFTAGNSTVTFNGTTSQQIITSTATVNNTFNNLTLNNGTNTNTLSLNPTSGTPTLDVNGLLTITKGTLSPGAYATTLAGGLTFSDTTNGIFTRTGGDSLTFDGSGTWTDNRTAKADLGVVAVSGASTTETLGSDAILTSVSGTGTLNGGTSRTLSVSSASSNPITSTFASGTGTVKYTGTSTINISTVTYNNLELAGATTYSLAGSLTSTSAIAGNLAVDSGVTLSTTSSNYNLTVAGNLSNAGTLTANSSTITVGGNVDFTSGTFTAGASTISLNGSGAQSFTSAGCSLHNLTVTNSSSSGITFVHSITLSSGGTFTDITPGSHLTFDNSWTYTFPNINWVGGSGNDIVMRSNSTNNGWWLVIAASNPTASYVDVEDSLWSGIGNKVATTNCINRGNNTAWTFNQNPNTPSSLGPTALTNGSWGNSNTPTFSFTLSDPDTGDTVKYEILISTHSDFSSPAIDYTSALAAQGAKTYTASPALADGTWYWEVKAIDNSSAVSGWASGGNFKVDATAPVAFVPTITTAMTNVSGTLWTNANSLNLGNISTTDATSGVASYSIQIDSSTVATSVSNPTLSGLDISSLPNGSHTLTATATDNAGNNRVSSSVAFGVDRAAPTTNIYLSPTNPNGTNSYYKTAAPQVTFTSSDSNSGASTIYYAWDLSNPSDQTLADFTAYASALTPADGVHTIYYIGTDAVGNKTATFSRQLKVDTIAPTASATASSSPNGSNNYYIGSAPTVTLSADDGSGSGVLNIQYKWDSGSYATYSTGLTPAEGAHTLYYYATDNAGNDRSGSPYSVTYHVETASQIVTLTSSPIAPNGSNNYYTGSAPSITLSATNSNSGIAAIKYHWGTGADQTYSNSFSAPEGINTLTYYATTNAGNNSATYTEDFKVDLTNPATDIYVSPSSPNGGGGYYTSSPQITFSISDGGSGTDGVYYRVGLSGGFSKYSTAINAPEGDNTVYYYGKDLAGNQTATYTREIKLDTLKPATTYSISPTNPNGNLSYYTYAPAITLTASDSGSGVSSIKYHWNADSDSTYSSPITPPEGTNVLTYYSVDVAGNSENSTAKTIKLDTTLPTTDIYLDPASPNGNNNYYTSAPQITFTSADGSGSGAGNIYYRFGTSGDYSVYTTAVTAPEGDNTIYYYGTDLAGNSGAGSPTSREIKVDTISPTVSYSISPANSNGLNGYYKTKPAVTLTAADGGSGVSAIKYNLNNAGFQTYNGAVTIPDGSNNTISYYAIDSAGNINSTATKNIAVDSTAPTDPGAPSFSPLTSPTNNARPTWNWTASSDSVSGINNYSINLIKNGGAPISEPSGNTTSFTPATDLTSGVYQLEIESQNNAGINNASGYILSAPLTVDTVAPTGTIAITNGVSKANDPALYATSSSVAFSLSAAATSVASENSVTQMRFSNDNLTYSDFENYAATKNWTLSSGDGVKNIYVEYKDVAGNISSPIPAQITLDTTGPNAFSLFLPAKNSWTNSTSVNFTWEDAKDTISGLSYYQFYLDDKLTKDNLSVKTDSLTVDNLAIGSHTFQVKAIDNLGNATASEKRTFGIDQIAPTIPQNILLANATDSSLNATNQSNISLKWDAAKDDGGSGVEGYLVSIGTSKGSTDVVSGDEVKDSAYSKLLDKDGTYFVTIQTKDAAGNLSKPSESYQFILDVTKPVAVAETRALDVSNRITANYLAYTDWSASNDATGTGIKEYQVLENNSVVGTVPFSGQNNQESLRQYVQTNLKPGQYSFKVQAVDNVGNVGAASPDAQVVVAAKDSFSTTLTNPTASPSGIVDSDSGKTSALITWTTSNLTTSQVIINGKTYGSTDPSLLNTSHSIVVPNLAASTTYQYQAQGQDIYGNLVQSGINTFLTNPQVKKQSSLEIMLQSIQSIFDLFTKASAATLQALGLKSNQINPTGNVLVYNISDPNNKIYASFLALNKAGAELQRADDGKNFATIATPQTAYYIDNNLTADKTYAYKVKDAAGQVSLRPDGSDTAAPVISNPGLIDEATQISDDNVQVAITWQTDKPATSQVIYGEGSPTITGALDSGLNMEHAVILTDLKAGTTYTYQVKSTAENNLTAQSSNLTFTTPANTKQESIIDTIVKSLQDSLANLFGWLKK